MNFHHERCQMAPSFTVKQHRKQMHRKASFERERERAHAYKTSHNFAHRLIGKESSRKKVELLKIDGNSSSFYQMNLSIRNIAVWISNFAFQSSVRVASLKNIRSSSPLLAKSKYFKLKFAKTAILSIHLIYVQFHSQFWKKFCSSTGAHRLSCSIAWSPQYEVHSMKSIQSNTSPTSDRLYSIIVPAKW